jgi:CO dehydrogenase/acetyl-CoA synthase beta subunit
MPLSAFSFGSLEVELRAKLDYSTGAIGCYRLDSIDLPEVRGGKIVHRRTKIRVVKGIEGL